MCEQAFCSWRVVTTNLARTCHAFVLSLLVAPGGVCANRPHVAAVCSFVMCRVPRSELRIDGSHRVTHIEGMPLATKYYKTRLALAVAHTLSPASTGDVPTAATSLLDGATCVVIVLDCTKVGAAAAQLSLPPRLPLTTFRPHHCVGLPSLPISCPF